MKVLVIGATGMLAKPVIEIFAKQGFDLRLFSRSVTPSMFPEKFEIVKGDVFNPADLQKAVHKCDAIHISLSKVSEFSAADAIIKVAQQNGVKLISYVSGCTVAEENRWFSMIDDKYRAEQVIIQSGIPYLIFRPTWFFESLDLMIRNRKAMMIGSQPNPYRWIAADDFASMIAEAYKKQEVRSKIIYAFGPEYYYMKDLLLKYGKHLHPEIKSVSVTPIWLMKLIAGMSGKKELKMVASMFSYFEKVKEPQHVEDTVVKLKKPETNFDKWLKSKNR